MTTREITARTEESIQSDCYRPLNRFLSVLVSKAAKLQEKAYLDSRREFLQRKIALIEEVLMRKRGRTGGNGFPHPFSGSDYLLEAISGQFRELEEKYEDLLVRVPRDPAEEMRWYGGKVEDFRMLSQ